MTTFPEELILIWLYYCSNCSRDRAFCAYYKEKVTTAVLPVSNKGTRPTVDY